MIEKYLWIAGSAIFTILGSIHLFYTFFTRKLFPENESVAGIMKNSFPVLTNKTTLWKAWIGFNASHSAGVIFIGVLNLFIAARYFFILQESWFLLLLNLITSLFYLWLGKKYWFSTPFICILISNGCFITGAMLIRIK